ncbi:CopG family transcriptional regulator [Caulobacter sp. Root1455]|uniref:ribbon-helix-helix domain-containing protein n=1 Tax=unclassified Caulobacter TaxID=2648921 RepID=UPI0006FFCEC3|nr:MULTISPECIES: CopG family transcriptional regulator [unclassified Caulobacter]KQY28277.1 CopG family transcriptional regulator [Caulobacter sp. Root487D2Y]KQY91824.1 CopG family transcriptional regulator [Caulobacter sp. Root1455]
MKPRHHLYLDDALTEALDRLGGKPGTSKSAIVADALRAYLDRRAASEMDTLFKVRLDRMSRQLNRLERDQKVLLESLALFVRYQLTVTAPLPEADKAAQAVGRERFQRFVDQVGRQLASGHATLDVDGDGEGAR